MASLTMIHAVLDDLKENIDDEECMDTRSVVLELNFDCDLPCSFSEAKWRDNEDDRLAWSVDPDDSDE